MRRMTSDTEMTFDSAISGSSAPTPLARWLHEKKCSQKSVFDTKYDRPCRAATACPPSRLGVGPTPERFFQPRRTDFPLNRHPSYGVRMRRPCGAVKPPSPAATTAPHRKRLKRRQSATANSPGKQSGRRQVLQPPRSQASTTQRPPPPPIAAWTKRPWE